MNPGLLHDGHGIIGDAPFTILKNKDIHMCECGGTLKENVVLYTCEECGEEYYQSGGKFFKTSTIPEVNISGY